MPRGKGGPSKAELQPGPGGRQRHLRFDQQGSRGRHRSIDRRNRCAPCVRKNALRSRQIDRLSTPPTLNMEMARTADRSDHLDPPADTRAQRHESPLPPKRAQIVAFRIAAASVDRKDPSPPNAREPGSLGNEETPTGERVRHSAASAAGTNSSGSTTPASAAEAAGGLRLSAAGSSPTSASISRAICASRWRFHMLA